MLARLLSNAGIFETAPFHTLDVDCSGGLVPLCEEFTPNVVAVGVDPLDAEVERLSARSIGWDSYICARVGTLDWTPVVRTTPGVLERSSARRYAELTQYDHVKEYYNAGSDLRVSETLLGVDQCVGDHLSGRLDFLKSDTDGYELGVLRFGRSELSEVLAVFYRDEL
jgi:hypothetical protein